MVRRQVAAHVIFCEQSHLKTDGPLDTAYIHILTVHIRHNPRPAFQFDIGVCPLQMIEFVQVVLERTVAGHGRSLVQSNESDIAGDGRMAVDVVHDFFAFRLEVGPGRSAVGVELDMGVVQYLVSVEVVVWFDTFTEFQRVERGYVVARISKIIGMEMQRVGEDADTR